MLSSGEDGREELRARYLRGESDPLKVRPAPMITVAKTSREPGTGGASHPAEQ